MKVNKYLNSKVLLQEETEDMQEKDVKTINITPEDLEAIINQVESDSISDFSSVGEELEKHMYYNRVLYLNDEVSSETVDHMIMLIHKWNMEDDMFPDEERPMIKIYIDTAGGDLMKATSLVSAIHTSKTPVHGHVDGIAMSAGFWILVATHYRTATPFAEGMYHTLRANSDISSLQEIKQTANYYESLQNKINNHIVSRTSISKTSLDKKNEMNLDWFLDSKEMLELGVIHAVL